MERERGRESARVRGDQQREKPGREGRGMVSNAARARVHAQEKRGGRGGGEEKSRTSLVHAQECLVTYIPIHTYKRQACQRYAYS